MCQGYLEYKSLSLTLMLKINGEEMIVVNFVATSKHSSVDKAIGQSP